MSAATVYECQNCDWEGPDDGTEEGAQPAKDVHLRHETGDTFSDLECPECGALVFPKDAEPQAKPFSVLLLYPDFVAETFGQETFYSWVTAKTPERAIKAAQLRAARANPIYFGRDSDDRADPDAFYPLLLLEGHHEGLDTGA